MRIALALGIAGVVAAGLLASASAGPPPPPLAYVAVTHARPVAGHWFTGVTVTPRGTSSIRSVNCDATIHRANLHGRVQRFYAEGVDGPAAVACGWKIPATARGPLRAQVAVVTSNGTLTSPTLSWRIKRT
jgi:hypothetical protein